MIDDAYGRRHQTRRGSLVPPPPPPAPFPGMSTYSKASLWGRCGPQAVMLPCGSVAKMMLWLMQISSACTRTPPGPLQRDPESVYNLDGMMRPTLSTVVQCSYCLPLLGMMWAPALMKDSHQRKVTLRGCLDMAAAAACS